MNEINKKEPGESDIGDLFLTPAIRDADRDPSCQIGREVTSTPGPPEYLTRSGSRFNFINPGLGNQGYLFWIIFIIAIMSVNSHADEADSTALNWAYQNGLEDGLFVSESENAKIYKIPFSYTIMDFYEQDWALKLKFPLTLGVYRLEAGNDSVDLDIMALVPGVELQMKLKDNWILIPSVGFGLGKDTSGGGIRYLYSSGIKNYFLFWWKNLDITFGNRLHYDGYSTSAKGASDHIPSFNAGLDMRFPMGFDLFKKPGFMSFYTVFYHYFNGVTVIDAQEKKLEIENQLEVGLTLGTIPSLKIWKLPVDRVGIGYRHGDGFSSISLTFGMPF